VIKTAVIKVIDRQLNWDFRYLIGERTRFEWMKGKMNKPLIYVVGTAEPLLRDTMPSWVDSVRLRRKKLVSRSGLGDIADIRVVEHFQYKRALMLRNGLRLAR